MAWSVRTCIALALYPPLPRPIGSPLSVSETFTITFERLVVVGDELGRGPELEGVTPALVADRPEVGSEEGPPRVLITAAEATSAIPTDINAPTIR